MDIQTILMELNNLSSDDQEKVIMICLTEVAGRSEEEQRDILFRSGFASSITATPKVVVTQPVTVDLRVEELNTLLKTIDSIKVQSAVLNLAPTEVARLNAWKKQVTQRVMLLRAQGVKETVVNGIDAVGAYGQTTVANSVGTGLDIAVNFSSALLNAAAILVKGVGTTVVNSSVDLLNTASAINKTVGDATSTAAKESVSNGFSLLRK